MRTQRDTYSGSVEIWVDGVKRFDVEGTLTGYVDVVDLTTTGRATTTKRAGSWDGRLEGLSQHNRLELIGHELELRLSNGNVGKAVMPDSTGSVRGLNDPPF